MIFLSNDVLFTNSKEVAQIRQSCNLKGIHVSLYYVTSRIVLFVCFISYVYLFGGALTAHKVFVSMALFNVIRIPCTRHLPQSISSAAELVVACGRIQKYLLLEEQVQQQQHLQKAENEAVVNVQSASASWDGQLSTFSNVNFALNKGELLIIIGPVGCGKTSLLLSLMHELPSTSGKISISTDSIAYVPQRPWIFSGTLMENILFGRPLEEKHFWDVVRATALEPDLETMPLKEWTSVGERGYKLSGGQKARVNLARALYADADLYILDDIFSAVDGKVGHFIVQQCINGYLREKTVVLVTHQVHFLANSLSRSSVLILDDHGNQQKLVQPISVIDPKERKIQLDELIGAGKESLFTGSFKSEELEENYQQNVLPVASKKVNEFEDDDENKSNDDDEDDHHDDQHSTSSKSSGPYLSYLRCGFHWFTFTLMLLSIFISQTLSQGSDFLLSMWTEAFEKNNATEVRKSFSDLEENNLYAYIYAGLIVALFVSTLIRATTFFSFCMTASRKLYNDSFEHVLLSPITFFHHTPAGRILNRFSRDIGIIDDYIPMTAFELQIVSLLGFVV